MKHLPQSKRNRLILVVAVTVAVLAGLWSGLLAPQKRKINEMAKLAAEKEIKVNNAQRIVSTSGQIHDSLDDSARKLEAIERVMASGDKYSWIISTITRFKEGRKIDIPHFSRETACDVGLLAKFPYQAISFHIRGSAFYHDLGKFVADFENTFPYFRVQNLELDPLFNPANSSNAAVEDPEKLNFKMEIVALVSPNSPQ